MPLNPIPTHLFLLFSLLLLAHLATAQSPVAQPFFPFPMLPQEFASKTACRAVYNQCIQVFRDCLSAVGANEPGRLGCEAYRNDVCEEHIRAGCDQLPNGGGSIGEPPPVFTTFLIVVPIDGTAAITSKIPTKTPTPTDTPAPTPALAPLDPIPTRTAPVADTHVVLVTTTIIAPQPPKLTITLTSTATEPISGSGLRLGPGSGFGSGSLTTIVITTVVAAIPPGPVTSTMVTRGLSFNVISGGRTRWGYEWWWWAGMVIIMGLGLGFTRL